MSFYASIASWSKASVLRRTVRYRCALAKRSCHAAFAVLVCVAALYSQACCANPTDPPNPTPNKLTMTTQWVGPDDHFVTAIAADASGWWWGTDDHGLWHYAPNAKPGQQWSHVRSTDGLYDDSVTALCLDNQGRLWVGTERRGVSVWNGSWWRNYDALTGPLGVHINAIAVNPVTTDVWVASESGISIYSDKTKTWRYITVAEGLASNKVTCLSFALDGTAIVGTASDGLMLGSRLPTAQPDGHSDASTDASSKQSLSYTAWRQVKAVDDPSVSEIGTGLPGNQINCLLTNKAGKIFCGTSTGLASSTDGGQTWTFLRGWSWQEKVQQGAPQNVRRRLTDDKLPLVDDFVSCLAFDQADHLYVGHRQRGLEVLDDSTGEQLYHSRFDAYGVDIKAIEPTPDGGVLVGNYGDGLTLVSWDGVTSDAETAPPRLIRNAELPQPAAAPTSSELKALRESVARTASNWSQPGLGLYQGEDWQTQGSWFERYGKQYAILCGDVWSGDVVAASEPGYSVTPQIGNSTHQGEQFSRWLQWLESDDPRVLFDPQVGTGRQAEWDDHGERYPMGFNGPDLWLTVEVPAGKHRVSLYFMNKDGHIGVTRYRDFIVQLRAYSDLGTIPQSYNEPNLFPVLAETRVKNFWPGVYESFTVSGPSKYYIRIAKNYSLNTILQGVFIDRLTGTDAMEKDAKRLSAAQQLWDVLDGRSIGGDAQREFQILALRNAAAANSSSELLRQWRAALGLWTDDDRDQARAKAVAMKAAAAANPKS